MIKLLSWFRYDPATDTWTMVANLSVGRDAIGDKQPFKFSTYRLLQQDPVILHITNGFLFQASVCWARSSLLWAATMALDISAWLRPMIAGRQESSYKEV